MTVTIQEATDFDACRALRIEVFVKEQGIAMEDEIDDLDNQCTHFLACDEGGTPVGTARVYEVGDVGKIGRVCVLASHRGTGLGAKLITHCIDVLGTRPRLRTARLGSQDHAVGFYERLGFKVVGDVYLDAGIPHYDMERAL
ncbi:GNAT family N-acetyltransferase [Celeribacter sp.]|uniref:GNAT family N-acetyltransferase n=1 Tax=Celeribacter sp. TaxID=1890673 RepID=UPI003A8DEE10